MTNDTLLFLDFDGVICDSLPETLVSSWLAYHKFILHDMPSSMPRAFKADFCRYRPYIKNGEDYIVLQHIIFRGLPVASQDDFDALKRNTGEEEMAYYKDVFYKARQELLSQDRRFWLSLNPIFLPIKSALLKTHGNPRIYILSTKVKEYILQILTAHGIEFPKENIIDSGSQVKLEIIKAILDNGSAKRALFIDDQIEHLKPIIDDRIEVFLASWGYVNNDSINSTFEIPALAIGDAVSLLEPLG